MRHTATYLLLFVALLLFTQNRSFAQGPFGIGLIVGEPTGISWKYRMSERHALDGAFGFSPFDRLRIHVDYLWTSRAFNDQRLTLSYGVGFAIGLGRRLGDTKRGILGYTIQETGFGIRGPVSLTYLFPRTPIELGCEIAPLLVLGPDPALGFDGGVLLRIYP